MAKNQSNTDSAQASASPSSPKSPTSTVNHYLAWTQTNLTGPLNSFDKTYEVGGDLFKQGSGASLVSSASNAWYDIRDGSCQITPKLDLPESEQDTSRPKLRVLGQPFSDVCKQYSMGPKLGEGHSGSIRLCKDRSSGKLFACKSIKKCRLKVKDVQSLQLEVAILEAMGDNQSVVHLQETFEDNQYVHLIMEYCEGGDLYARIQECKRFSEADAAEVVASIMDVVQKCHVRGILHRDLKPENILLSKIDSNISIRVADFGVATVVESGQDLSFVVGSSYYIAPEILKGCYGLEADIWSVGVILYILLCGVPPFYHQEIPGVFAAIQEGRVDMDWGPWKSISYEAKDLVRRMLTMDRTKRATAREVLYHPWLQHNGCSPATDQATLEAMQPIQKTTKKCYAMRQSKGNEVAFSRKFLRSAQLLVCV